VKTGYTELAGQTFVAEARRNGRTLIVSVLGSYDRYADAIALFDWAFSSTRSACGR
jgi:D-alanyl-D-alanine carboxypeptidase (penicillin-binding protein 5/6)